MNKAISYVIAFIGVALIALSTAFTQFLSSMAFLQGVKSSYILIAGIVLVVLGIFFVLTAGGSSAKKQQSEVPIYEGEGRKRRIVGYRKMGK